METQKPDEALDDLLILLEEKDPSDLIDSMDIEALLEEHISKEPPLPSGIQKFKKKSNKFPSFAGNPNLAAFIASTTAKIRKIKPHDPAAISLKMNMLL